MKEKVKGTEGEMKWREGIGSPKNFGVAPPICQIPSWFYLRGPLASTGTLGDGSQKSSGE